MAGPLERFHVFYKPGPFRSKPGAALPAVLRSPEDVVYAYPETDLVRSSGRVLLILCCLCSVVLWSAPQEETVDRAQAEALLREGKPAEALPLLLKVHHARPSAWEVCQQIGLAYTQVNELPKAAKFYRETLRLNPGFLPARKNLATVLWFLGDKKSSEADFRSILRAHPRDPVAHLYLGLAQFERKEFAAASINFEGAGDLAMANPEVLPSVLEAYLASRNEQGVSRITHQMNTPAASDPELIIQCAELLLRYGKAREAAASLLRIEGACRATAECELVLAEAQLALGDVQASTARLEQLTSQVPTRAEPFRLLAAAYDMQGKPEKAYQAYQNALELDPASEATYVELAQFASAHQNNKFALQVIERGLSRSPQGARLLMERGVLQALEGDYAAAGESFSLAGAADPKWNLPWLGLGVSRLQQGAAVEASLAFAKAREISPRDYRAYYLYATALNGGDNSAQRAEVISSLKKAIEIAPQEASPHAALGQAYQVAGQARMAASQFETALQLDPNNLTALYQLGLAYRNQGRKEDSRRLFDRFRAAKGKASEQEISQIQILRILLGRSGT